MTEKLHKTDEEWRRMLTPEQYRVARTRGTEPAFTGAYWNTKTAGTYKCVCCGQPLHVQPLRRTPRARFRRRPEADGQTLLHQLRLPEARGRPASRNALNRLVEFAGLGKQE
jgi:hypothetical protein